jgi:hypothetical protein
MSLLTADAVLTAAPAGATAHATEAGKSSTVDLRAAFDIFLATASEPERQVLEFTMRHWVATYKKTHLDNPDWNFTVEAFNEALEAFSMGDIG